MLAVPASGIGLGLLGFDVFSRTPAPAYLVDKFEVTNRHFKRFVDSGGYQNREYWTEEFIRDGEQVAWEDAMAEFRDRTGRPGPSTREVGTYPSGQEDYPVSGVSWYEAAAYAEFAGKSLPTIYHWSHSAGTFWAAEITPQSNIDGTEGPLPVGASRGVTPWGAYDMAGNVREWCSNEQQVGRTRFILGGAWADPEYTFNDAQAASSFDRSETNGFRLVEYGDEEPIPESFLASVALPFRDYTVEQPVSDDVFQVYRDLYSYDPVPLEPMIDAAEESDRWSTQRVTFNATYDNERIPAYLFLRLYPGFPTNKLR